MKFQSTLLWAGLLTAGLTTPILAATRSEGLFVDVTGDMRVEIAIPVVDDVDITTPVTAGRIELSYSVVVPGVIGRFWLNQATLNFADFSFSRSFPVGDYSFRAMGVHLVDAVEIVAFEAPAGVYAFTLLPEDVTVYGAGLINGELKAGNDHPTENVTGTIDLNTNTFTARIVLEQQDEIAGLDVGGPLTVNLTGTIRRGPPAPDADGDGIPDATDNCVLVPNPGQQPIASPVVTAPPNVQLATCASTGFGVATGVDVCNGLPVAITHDAPAKFPVGTTVVTWTGQTSNGKTATATQQVVVVDTTPPVFLSVPAPITVYSHRPPHRKHPGHHGHGHGHGHGHDRDDCDDDRRDRDDHDRRHRHCDCRDSIDIGLAMAADDCGAGTPLVTHNAPHYFPFGTTTVTWKAKDESGNRTTATQLVTVKRCRHHHDRHDHHDRDDRHDRDHR